MKLHYYIFLLGLFIISSCSKDNEPEADSGQIFTVGGKEYAFKGAVYYDFGYSEGESNKLFTLVSQPITGTTDFDELDYVLAFDAFSEGREFKYGTYSLDYSKGLNGDVYFATKDMEEPLELRSGSFSIENLGNDRFLISVDGILNNGEAVKGSFRGEFTKITNAGFRKAFK